MNNMNTTFTYSFLQNRNLQNETFAGFFLISLRQFFKFYFTLQPFARSNKNNTNREYI